MFMPTKVQAFIKQILFLFAAFLFVTAPASANITVDGLVSDWGVTPGAFGASDWTPDSGIYYSLEDQNPATDFLSPGYGGQKFDVEAIYFSRDTNFAYIAVVSGFPLEGRNYLNKDYYAGDLTIDFGSDGSWDFGVETTGDWGSSVAGGLYNNPSWVNPHFSICGPYALSAGNYLGLTTFSYDNSTYQAFGHYVFEMAIPISLFGNYWADSSYTPDLSLKWTMSCGNDCTTLHVPFKPGFIPTPNIPEPSGLLLLGLGLAGLAFTRIKR